MEKTHATKSAVLIIYYSFSAQTASLVKSLAKGLAEWGTAVEKIRLSPTTPLRFPLRSLLLTFKMMLTTFFRKRVAIEEPAGIEQKPDLIILAGPTWSYNPSGPILFFLDRFGQKYLADRPVMPMISCRGYWRMHAAGLARLLKRCGARPAAPLIFTHPNPEPWRTIGVFLKITGRTPEKSRFLKKHYPRFGHSHEQINRAEGYGKFLAETLQEEGVAPACRRLAELVNKERASFMTHD